ncbi:hypothetical protein FDP41_010898 [Naegleria fowleri]|uniref:Uncharacterized protein n=1 Tax=Naegleria fowleri TaxID=5763 RepID=A0A6A5CCD9_NAEFO|nr:uncharacterized protein FDP41_010898 [Naegleria fowleri]KAF0982919.1 hypothetical protein FDP41_010898 [Naegleria fowleri]CAG4711737.1 unnamed protein product [Naegleria fowleri]
MMKQTSSGSSTIYHHAQNIPKETPLSLKQLKNYFVLKQFKHCISFIQQHFGSDWQSISGNSSFSLSQKQNIFSILIQCYYETKEYSAIHRLFEKSRNNIPSQCLKLYIEFCLKLKLFEKANEMIFDDNQLSEQERRNLENQLHKERLEQEALMETAKQTKAYSSLLSSMYITKPSHEEYETSTFASQNKFEHSESSYSHGSNNFQIAHQEHKVEQHKPSNRISSLASLTRYILDFISNYKVELALHVVSFVVLYVLLK